MSIRQFLIAATATLLAFWATRLASAAIPQPADLLPGDTYQLVFNSSVRTDALSNDITYYNDLVQSAADVAGIGLSEGVTWRAIASTATMDARTNAAVGANTPVFNLRQGQLEKVAEGFDDLWDGALSSAPAYDEFGQPNFGDPWTGSLPNGLRATGSTLGDSGGAAWCGRPSLADDRWLTFLQPSTLTLLSVYALSEVITVTDADFNQDGFINGGDFLVWQRGFGDRGSPLHGDANGDGSVDGLDLAIWKQSLGSGFEGNAGGTAAVPEPSSVLMVAIGSLLNLNGRRRRTLVSACDTWTRRCVRAPSRNR